MTFATSLLNMKDDFIKKTKQNITKQNKNKTKNKTKTKHKTKQNKETKQNKTKQNKTKQKTHLRFLVASVT